MVNKSEEGGGRPLSMPPKQPRPMSLRKTQQSGEGAIAGGAGRGLPAGWTTAKDPTSGTPYYFNATTGKTQWEFPMQPRVTNVTVS